MYLLPHALSLPFLKKGSLALDFLSSKYTLFLYHFACVVINVTSIKDFEKRRAYDTTQTVVLRLQNDIVINSMVTLDGNYSCTVIESAALEGYTIAATFSNSAAVFISGVDHMLMLNVHVSIPDVADPTNAPKCPFQAYQYMEKVLCPAVAVVASASVQIARANLGGAVHLFSNTDCLLDSCTIFSDDWGVIVGADGNFGTPDYAHTGNVVSNNRIHAWAVGISVAYGTVGCAVLNNYITDFIFAGVTLGRGAHNTGDAMSNLVANNYITLPANQSSTVLPDGAGIYTAVHWVNPNNTLRCNYVVGPIPHCVYLDFGSSGVLVDGVVCVGSGNGLKVNTGHANTIRGMLMIENTANSGFIAPQLLWNCVSDPGTYWDRMRVKYYNTPEFHAMAPWLVDFCSITDVDGVPCNGPVGLSAEATGNCSGMPTRNYWQSAVVIPPKKKTPQFYGTDYLPSLPQVNTLTYTMYSAPSNTALEAERLYGLAFLDSKNGDYGLRPSSRILVDQPGFPSCPRSAVGNGCSATQVRINVLQVSDIMTRTLYPRTQTVVLVLQTDLTLTSWLELDGRFSCTILRSGSSAGYTLKAKFNTTGAVYLHDVSHFLMHNVHVAMPPVATSDKKCPWLVFKYMEKVFCPAVAVLNSHSVTIAKGHFGGAVHVFTSWDSLVDSNKITSQDWGVIVGSSGGYGKPNYTPQNVVVSNNVISAWAVGVNMAYGVVGCSVINNYITDFIFAGVTLGRGAHNTGDAMSNVIADNYIFTKNDTVGVLPDGAGIYTAVHWINPNNTLSCNYIVGPIAHCIYLDFGSSGVTVDGTVCVGTGNGLKVNTGHNNVVTGMIQVEQYANSGFIAPQLLWNCISDPGTYWDKMRRQYFDTPQFRAQYPWLTNFCKITHVNGVNCNPAGGMTAAATGNCSGMPTGNVWQTAVVVPWKKKPPTYFGLDYLPSLPQVNSLTYAMYNGTNAANATITNNLDFIDQAKGDYGLKPTSRILVDLPTFKSCPLSQAGPKSVADAIYFARFTLS
eukprot:SM000047S16861  [mRNA]  locus=s47:296354:306521:- [translate_table: standard]